MELLDLVDKDGKPIGKTIVRSDNISFNDGEYVCAVHVWLQNSNGEFLIQKTSKIKGNVFAVTGGMVESGESSKPAAFREVWEELGIDISRENVVNLGHIIHDNALLLCVFLLQKDFSHEKFTLQKREVASIRWFDLDKIEKMNAEKTLRGSSYTSLNLVKQYLSKLYLTSQNGI
ncbi:MAG: NUDIX hydrolase [Christensenellaceae bacterium]|nr:NUDIX hydrolase [Christensenellaceae bacterium]